MIVDTHIHVWDLSRASYPWLEGNQTILNRSYQLTELEEECKKVGVTTGVLVQAGGNLDDTELMFEVAEKNEWIKGVVAWVPLMNPEETESSLKNDFLKRKLFKGVRHQVHDEKDSRWLLQPGVIESLSLLEGFDIPYDIVGIMPAHIKTALDLAHKIPGLRMVFDHMNQPPIAERKRFGEWGELMKEASKHKNFFVKISGLGTTARKQDWGEEDIKPYVDFVLENFGVDRCFCGGDWPVSLLAGSYSRTWEIYTTVLNQLTNEQEKEKILAKNGREFYAL
jgi:L-fuconolactonase